MICHGERVTGPDGETRTKVVLDRKMTWQGSLATQLADVEAFIYEAAKTYRPSRVCFDPSLFRRLSRFGRSAS
jgi:hypothetical protein